MAMSICKSNQISKILRLADKFFYAAVFFTIQILFWINLLIKTKQCKNMRCNFVYLPAKGFQSLFDLELTNDENIFPQSYFIQSSARVAYAGLVGIYLGYFIYPHQAGA